MKGGENELARQQFREAMALDPADTQVALECAFLYYETKQQAEARRHRRGCGGGSCRCSRATAFTFLIEDPATVWNPGAPRYAAIAGRYRPLTPDRDRLAIDVNGVDR